MLKWRLAIALTYLLHPVCFANLHQCAILRHATVYKVGEPSSMFIKWASRPVGIVAGVPIYIYIYMPDILRNHRRCPTNT